MEFHCDLAQKACALRRTHQASPQKIRARLAAALWPGKMVSRRTTPPLGARVLLAQRWNSNLARRFAHRRRVGKLRPRRERRESIARTHFESCRRGSKVFDSRL